MLANGSPLAREAIERMQRLFAIEAEIHGQKPEARLATRHARSAPLMVDLHAWLEATLRRISGKSDLAKAIRYTLAQWTALTTVLRDGRACLHNNAAERQMRPLALGRKNYLFAGSLEGGRRAAIIYTLVGTAEFNGWDPQAYLRVLLDRIADHPINRIGELAPCNLRPDASAVRAGPPHADVLPSTPSVCSRESSARAAKRIRFSRFNSFPDRLLRDA